MYVYTDKNTLVSLRSFHFGEKQKKLVELWELEPAQDTP